MKLYKFRSPEKLELTLDILLNQRLYCADWNDLNDPMEGIFEYRTGGDTWRAQQLAMIRQHKLGYRVCSLAREWNSPLLWAHYAHGFRGVAIEIEFPELEPQLADQGWQGGDQITDVDYRESFRFADTDNHDDPQSLSQRILTSKHEAWSYEGEVRILSRRPHYSVRGAIRQVIIGPRASDITRDAIERTVSGTRIRLAQLVIGRDGLELCEFRSEPSELPIDGGSGWLHRLLDAAVEGGSCTRWRCTTCSSEPLRRALIRSAGRANPVEPSQAMAEELAELTPPVDEEAVGFALRLLIDSFGREASSRVAALWPAGPAAEIFHRIIERDRERDIARARHRAANDSENVRRRRAEKKAAKLKALRERELKKAERDALGRAAGRITQPPRRSLPTEHSNEGGTPGGAVSPSHRRPPSK